MWSASEAWLEPRVHSALRWSIYARAPVCQVALAQKMMITKANIAGKLVLCATEMLASMQYNPLPTRAEMTGAMGRETSSTTSLKGTVRCRRQGGAPSIIPTCNLVRAPATLTPWRTPGADVANAVFDGVDAVMLSGESANGAFPASAVATMARIVENAELGVDYNSLFAYLRQRNAGAWPQGLGFFGV
jgi:pyruvate kinase